MTDDRRDMMVEAERDILPIVARGRGGAPIWLLVTAAVIFGIILFFALDARRRAVEAPPVQARSLDLADLPTALPALQIPPEAPPTAAPQATEIPDTPAAPSYIPMGSPLGSPVIMRTVTPPLPPVQPVPPAQTVTPPPRSMLQSMPTGGSAIVIDNRIASPSNDGLPNNGAAPNLPAGIDSTTRAHAGMLANRSTTVVQGTLIHAVLETGFDSTRPGFARAMVSHDIRGFDGTRVLIPRGSRLIGEYQADVRSGQKRALIMWTRLIRPDGATIEVGSPASDPVGRGGIKAEVNDHFFQRFSGAILQSALDVGVNLASRSANRSVIVALPSSGGVTGQIVQPTNVTPTLKVKPATSVSVFVARDLDFTEVENRP